MTTMTLTGECIGMDRQMDCDTQLDGSFKENQAISVSICHFLFDLIYVIESIETSLFFLRNTLHVLFKKYIFIKILGICMPLLISIIFKCCS